MRRRIDDSLLAWSGGWEHMDDRRRIGGGVLRGDEVGELGRGRVGEELWFGLDGRVRLRRYLRRRIQALGRGTVDRRGVFARPSATAYREWQRAWCELIRNDRQGMGCHPTLLFPPQIAQGIVECLRRRLAWQRAPLGSHGRIPGGGQSVMFGVFLRMHALDALDCLTWVR